ncbi:uncharacterized protein LOC120200719 [Hibiscus syriacus]|uniref:uncharacterized protein LOC120200719 n=1 Tax=Hibiscus syriacus TaxID=106335 RepID=UPI001921E680|nr:uncharacterized protein LOC120200719 [Hibiscus syriacus]
MATELVSFFTNLIGVEDPLVRSSSAEDLKGLLNYSLPEGAIDFLTRKVSDMEIKEALFKQEKDKSPDPDGYTSGFFKAAWDIVGTDFISVVRLAPFFPGMISLSQSVFVKGRNIIDNTLLVQEIINGYYRKSLSPRCAVKIDLQKAFDSVSWEFLLNVLAAMRLPDIFYNWIKACITTPMFSLSLNDVVLGVQSTLDKFYEHSGLKLNAQKTELYDCGLNMLDLEQIRLATGFRLGQLPMRYLRVPLVTRKLTGKDCEALLTKIKDKLRHWSNKNLSYGGMLQLVKTVLFSIFNYWSRQLVLPKGIIRDIECLCMRFFWKGSDSPAKGARVG